jgi:hypothetical protein
MDIEDYPWEWPPQGFEPFDLNGSAPINPGSTSIVFPPYAIPLLQEGWVTGLGIELSSYGAGTYYQLLLGGNPMRDYARVTVPIGAPNTPVKRHIKLRPNQDISLNVVNGGAAILAVRWSIYGWYYPRRGSL